MDDPAAIRLPKSVDLRLLGVCNLSCSFCFGPRHHVRATRFDEICKLLPRLRHHGVSRLVITGGEPLLVKSLHVLLEEARRLGFRIVLSTNGSLLPRRHTEVLRHLDWLALPLDGPSAAIHDVLRPGRRSSFEDVATAFSLSRRVYPGLKIKLGTVIQPGNIGAVAMIPPIVAGWGIRPDIWKLYEVSFSNYGADNRIKLELANEVFEEEVRYAQLAARASDWKTIVYRNTTRDGQYLFMEPSGEAMIILDGNEVTIGSFLDDFPSVLSRWRDYVDDARLDANAELTYFHDE